MHSIMLQRKQYCEFIYINLWLFLMNLSAFGHLGGVKAYVRKVFKSGH